MRALAAAVLLCACSRAAPPAAPADAGGPRPGEIAIPMPAAAAGEVAVWQREGTLETRGRMFHKGNFRGNVSWTGARASTIRAETLAVSDGRASRLRLTYSRHATTAQVGGMKRAIGPALEGRSYLVELGAGEPRVSLDGGGAPSAGEVERVTMDVRDFELRWRPAQGRTLLIGQTLPGPTPLVLKSARGGAAHLVTRARVNIGAGLGAPIEADVDAEALLDLATGRLRELRDGGVASLTGARVDGVKNAELAGTAEWTGAGLVSPPAEASASTR
jgi:hypothetical protein